MTTPKVGGDLAGGAKRSRSPDSFTSAAITTGTFAAFKPSANRVSSPTPLELRLHSLPNSSVIVIRLVNPQTGEVVREYPPERLEKALEELRARAASHIDRKA